MENSKKGSLVIVGTGISVAGQMTIVSENHIKQAEIVITGVPNKIRFDYVKKLNPNIIPLNDLYAEGKSRIVTYREMKEIIISHVVAGKKVCAVFYGHPGVFVEASHTAMYELKESGYAVKMEPGISAEDCLIADLGLDPAEYGCQSYEATQYLTRKYTLDPYQMQIFWQIGYAGELTLRTSRANKDNKGLTVFTDKLLKYYPEDKEVIIYEASEFPMFEPVIRKMPLRDLPDSKPTEISTLVVPGEAWPELDEEILTALGSSREEFTMALSAE